jgi:hypothetical protein
MVATAAMMAATATTSHLPADKTDVTQSDITTSGEAAVVYQVAAERTHDVAVHLRHFGHALTLNTLTCTNGPGLVMSPHQVIR